MILNVYVCNDNTTEPCRHTSCCFENTQLHLLHFRLQQCNETHNIRYYFIYAPSILLSYTWIAKKNLLVVTFEGVVILSHKLCVPLNILYFKLALSTQKRSKPLKYQLKINSHSKNFENTPQNSFCSIHLSHERVADRNSPSEIQVVSTTQPSASQGISQFEPPTAK